jgi:hypothetical protein
MIEFTLVFYDGREIDARMSHEDLRLLVTWDAKFFAIDRIDGHRMYVRPADIQTIHEVRETA